ncbi:sensor histidine kinase [Amedibacterium intestinale]
MAIMIALFQNFLAKKLHLNEIMIEFEKKNYSYLSIICISILIIMAFAWTQIIIPKGKAEFRLEEVMIIFLVITFSIVLVQYAYNLLKIKQENEYNQIVLHQQQLYIQDLEDIQQNMRAFKHDYKNMMSSLYLNSKEGNIKKVENLIQGMIDDFDDTIDSKMALTTQLSNIRESEVKSLLFKKITDIYHKKISFHLEVLYPLHKNKIQTIDLVRILGILMDNAIEEVEQNHNDLTLLILQEENSLTIVVENYVEKEVNINDINNSGFTTKKDHSGIGLQSLETIIEKYPNISHKVSCRNHRFIQEIIIFNS